MHKMLLSEDDLVYPSFYFVKGVSTSLGKCEGTCVLGKASSFRHRNCLSFSLSTGIARTIQRYGPPVLDLRGLFMMYSSTCCFPVKYISCDL